MFSHTVHCITLIAAVADSQARSTTDWAPGRVHIGIVLLLSSVSPNAEAHSSNQSLRLVFHVSPQVVDRALKSPTKISRFCILIRTPAANVSIAIVRAARVMFGDQYVLYITIPQISVAT